MSRASRKELRSLFLAYRQAYAAAGLGTVVRWWDSEAHTSGEYRSGALDLILEEPNEFRNGGIICTPSLNPVSPQSFPGASASFEPVGLVNLGGTVGEACARLRAATAALWAVLEAERAPRIGGKAAPRAVDAAALAYLEGLE